MDGVKTEPKWVRVFADIVHDDEVATVEGINYRWPAGSIDTVIEGRATYADPETVKKYGRRDQIQVH